MEQADRRAEAEQVNSALLQTDDSGRKALNGLSRLFLIAERFFGDKANDSKRQSSARLIRKTTWTVLFEK